MKRTTFSKDERDVLLSVKGVGPKVVERFEQLGIVTLQQLAEQEAAEICAGASALVGSTCWKNSPQARRAVAAAIAAAKTACQG